MNLLDRLGVKKAAALIVLFYLVVQLAGLKTAGLTDDDDFYVPAGISYARWLGRALTFDGNVWSKADRDAAFQINNEHPPVAKYVFGICHALFGKWLGPTDGARVGTVLFSTMIAAFLLALAISHLGQRRGLAVGGLAVVFLLAMPRFYFHSHAATLDVPVAAMYLASVAFVLWGERSTRAAILAGVVFGLASATKLNAPFLVFESASCPSEVSVTSWPSFCRNPVSTVLLIRLSSAIRIFSRRIFSATVLTCCFLSAG